jgi:hypothetical protein
MSKPWIYTVVSLAAFAACGEKENTSPPLLEMPAIGQGLQISMMTNLEPGLETERCKFFRVPDDGLYVQREVTRYTPGSHHVLLYTTNYRELPTHTASGEPVDTSGIFDCSKNGATGDWDIIGAAGGAQSPDGPPVVDGLPEGTALKFEGGTLLLINAHYINASTQPLTVQIAINLYTVPAEQVTQEAGIFFIYNPFIHVPPLASSDAHEICPVAKDVTLVNAESHMHRRGVGYVANLRAADGTLVQEIYSGHEWEQVPNKVMSPPLALAAGQLIDFKCSYMNTEDRVVSQGRTTRDEMCMFLGLYYPKDTKTELCSITDDWKGRYLRANWVGRGTTGGAGTATCLGAATGPDAAPGDFDACVVGSCPALSSEVSNAARCLATKGLGRCAECSGDDKAACGECVNTTCGPMMTALGAADCP